MAVATLGVAYNASRAQDSTRSVADGVYTAEQADRGQAQFSTHCAACHGVALNGTDAAPALAGTTFLGNWSGQPLADLFSRIRTTMPANDPGSLGGRTVADITAYLLMVNRFPAGSAELPHDAQLLQQIRVVSAPPETHK
jgi:mono/diheme cytochrome c family protein